MTFMPPAHVGRIERPLSDTITAARKMASQRRRSASASFRLQHSRNPGAQPMLHRRPSYPSRRRPRQHARGEAIFPCREAGASSRPTCAGGVHRSCCTARSGRPEATKPLEHSACTLAAFLDRTATAQIGRPEATRPLGRSACALAAFGDRAIADWDPPRRSSRRVGSRLRRASRGTGGPADDGTRPRRSLCHARPRASTCASRRL